MCSVIITNDYLKVGNMILTVRLINLLDGRPCVGHLTRDLPLALSIVSYYATRASSVTRAVVKARRFV